MRVGQFLLEEGRGISLRAVARSLDVEVRTLSNWRRKAREATPERKLGRPSHTREAHRLALWRVGRELRSQRYPGWRAVSHALQGGVPDRLIQLYVRRFKDRRKRRRTERITRNRMTVTVLARDAIWGQDGTHVGRRARAAVETQVIRDRGSLAFIGLQSGPTAGHQDVLRLLRETVLQRGTFPLVYARDNGSMYTHEEVARYLEAHQVIVLRNLPRTAQHNGATERSIRELKDATGLGKGVRIDNSAAAHADMSAAAAALNSNRVRMTKGFKTANELDDMLPAGYNCGRDRFYRECRENMAKAVQESQTRRGARMAEREAVFATLERFGLIKRSRGGEPHVQKQEIFS